MGLLSKIIPGALKKDKSKESNPTSGDPSRVDSRPPPSEKTKFFSTIDPILGHKTSKPFNPPTPKVLRRGSKKLTRSRKGCSGTEVACMSNTSFVGFTGDNMSYQYEFTLKYGTLKGDAYQD